MGQIKWYKRDPAAALRGMRHLSLEERGAYNTVLDLIYYHDGALDDDDRFIAGYLGVDMRVWKRLKASLIAAGKLYVENGLLRNERADAVVDEALARVVAASYAGKESAKAKAAKSKSKSSKNRHIASTGVETGVETDVQQIENKNKKEDIPDGISSSSLPSSSGDGDDPPRTDTPPKGRKRRGGTITTTTGDGDPIPEDWIPELTDNARALIRHWPDGAYDRQVMAFEDHARTHGRLAKDWQAAFRTWLRKAEERRIQDEQQQRRSHEPQGTGNTMFDAVVERQARRAADERREPRGRAQDRSLLDGMD